MPTPLNILSHEHSQFHSYSHISQIAETWTRCANAASGLPDACRMVIGPYELLLEHRLLAWWMPITLLPACLPALPALRDPLSCIHLQEYWALFSRATNSYAWINEADAGFKMPFGSCGTDGNWHAIPALHASTSARTIRAAGEQIEFRTN